MQVRSISGPGKRRPASAKLSALIGLILLGALPGFTQTASPLAGKTIRVYNPVPGETLYLDMSGTGYPMTPESGTGWVVHTIRDSIPFHILKFGIRSAFGASSFWIGRLGRATIAADAFSVEDFSGGNSLWIVIDPSGPETAPPALLTEAPKVVQVLNPWPVTAPVLAFAGGTRKGMLTLPNNCGWFWAFVMGPGEQSFFLEEVNGNDTYGSAGLGNRTPYNLAPEFVAKGSSLWLDTDLNSWLAAYPGKDRPCGYQMAATVRDFSVSHPDFDFDNLVGEQLLPGMVKATLGPARKPERTATTSPLFNKFEEWFATLPGTNAETCVDIPMSKTGDGMWEYDSYQTPEHGFWPIDGFATANGSPNPHNEKTKNSCYVKPDGSSWVTNQAAHNMNFCMESHATFIYQKGQKFEFRGDDDVWVYINQKLVVDLGGVHTPKSVVVDLDSLGLVAGQSYAWDFFSCDRQPCASNLRIKTSIYFKQQRSLEAEPVAATPGTYRIRKFTGGIGSCGSAGDTVLEVPVAALTYTLRNAAGANIGILGEGSFHGGGIVIATPSVAVDTGKIRDLPPGPYRIVAYEPANSAVTVQIPFTIARSSGVEFEAPVTGAYPKNTLAKIIVANREGGSVSARAAPYTVVFSAGLWVYLDAARTLPIASGTVLTTNPTGYDTLWATGSWEDTSDRAYSLSIPGSSKTMVLTFVGGSSTIRVRLNNGDRDARKRPRHDILGRKRSFGRPFLKSRPIALPEN